MELYLSLGSNQGDRKHNIETALSLLNIELNTPYKKLSSIVETEPWGFESDDRFLNAAVLYELQLPKGYNPEAEGLIILDKCKSIEAKLGRKQAQMYNDQGERVYLSRSIDIDILLLGDDKIDCDELTVPHKLMWEREFVMEPLKEILPQWQSKYDKLN